MRPATLFEVVRTFDTEYVKRIFSSPDCYPTLSDDFTPPPDEMRPHEGDHIVYLRPTSGDGVFFFHAVNPVLWSVHAAIPKKDRQNSLKMAAMAALWMRKNTACRCIMSMIPAGNYPAMRLCEAVGFKMAGNIKKSTKRGGRLKDLRIYSLEMPDG